VNGVPDGDVPGGTTRRPTPRVRTIVFGAVLLVVSVLSLVALLTDVHIDGAAVALGTLVAAGVALVAGGVASARREARAARHG
jgi:predicted phage tail protein